MPRDLYALAGTRLVLADRHRGPTVVGAYERISHTPCYRTDNAFDLPSVAGARHRHRCRVRSGWRFRSSLRFIATNRGEEDGRLECVDRGAEVGKGRT
jgi:hypothetical protein